MNQFSLEGKVALVTGASYGIGFAIATAMAGAGATMGSGPIRAGASTGIQKQSCGWTSDAR